MNNHYRNRDIVTGMVTIDQAMNARPANDIISMLAERYPRCFAMPERRRWPIKIGIREDIIAALPDIDQEALGFALRVYCANVHYLKRSTENTARIDLQGRPVGVVSAGDAANAKRKLERQRKRHRALAEAHRIDEVKDIRDKAVAIRQPPHIGEGRAKLWKEQESESFGSKIFDPQHQEAKPCTYV